MNSKADKVHFEAKKRILMVVPRGYLPELTGGLELAANEVAQIYVQQQFDVHLAAECLAKGFNKVSKSIIRKLLGPYSNSHNINSLTVYKDPWHPYCLSELITQVKPSIIILFTSGVDDSISKVVDANLPTVMFLCGAQMSKQLKLTKK